MASSTPGQVLGRQIRHWRKERNLSAQELANRLAEIGSSLDRRAIFKIETESRGVNVDEWLQLAHALAVPPPLLFLDLESGEDIAVAPEVVLHPWIVWGWIAGEHASPVSSPRGGALASRVEEFSRATTAVRLYRSEEETNNAVANAKSAIKLAEYTEDEEGLKAARAQKGEALRELAHVLDAMIENGMAPPAKTPDTIETIRSLGLSRHPDSLRIFQTPPAPPSGRNG